MKSCMLLFLLLCVLCQSVAAQSLSTTTQLFIPSSMSLDSGTSTIPESTVPESTIDFSVPVTTDSRPTIPESTVPVTIDSSSSQPLMVSSSRPATPSLPAVSLTSVGQPTTTNIDTTVEIFLTPTITSAFYSSAAVTPTTVLIPYTPRSVGVGPTTSLYSTTATVTTQSPEPPTDTESPTSVIDFVKNNPVAFSIVGASVAFVITMCCCLGCVVVCRKRITNRRQRRRDKILDQAGDVWIVNTHAALRSDSPGPAPQPAQQAAAALQMPPQSNHRNLVLSNPQASQSSLLQYHEMPDLVGSPTLPTLSPMTSYSALITSPNTSTSQAQYNLGQPSAPPRRHI